MRMSFDLSNAPTTFQHCMMEIFLDRVELVVELFIEGFYVFGETFADFLSNFKKVLQQ